jgi:two-component system OmpR family sensor kinase
VRSRILAAILAVSALGLVAAGGTAYLIGRQGIVSDVDLRLAEQVTAARFVALEGDSAGQTFTTTREALEAIVATVVPDRNGSSLGILGGRAAFVPGVSVAFDLPSDPAFVDRVLSEVSDGTVRLGTATTELGELRYIAAPVAIDDERGVFVIAVDLHAELAAFNDAFRNYVLVAVGALAIIGLVGFATVGRLLAPIRRLRIAAEEITATQRTTRIPVVGRDDVSELTGTVNDMLDRLDSALTNQRRLLDDVQHELKTPITIVRGHLELLDPSDPADTEATRAIAIDELDRMSGLIDEIGVLAESRMLVMRRDGIASAELTAEVLAKAQGIPGHDWRQGGAAASRVSVDRQKIVQAWLQLADNAAKYSPAGSPIFIGSTDLQGEVEFWVRDGGPGIPVGAEERILERFGRADTTGVSGSGLGLSIVQSIVRAHGGRMIVASSVNGSRVGFALPLVRERARIAVSA